MAGTLRTGGLDHTMTGYRLEPFWRRRLRHMAVFGVLLGLSCAVVYLQYQQLMDTGFTTGYALLAALGILSSYSLKKRWSFLRFLGTSSTWLHIHVYLALGSFVFFLIHIGFRVPDGWFEQLLACLFMAVSLSGVWGLYITRTYPRKLSNTRIEYIFEQIPTQRYLLMQEAETIVLQNCQASPTLGDFYRDRLLPYFAGSRSFWYLAFPTGRLRRNLMLELRHLDRYLAVDQRNAARDLGRLIQDRDDMDYQFALQGQLKGWLFFHIGCSAVLVILAIFHTVLVHAFDGGAL